MALLSPVTPHFLPGGTLLHGEQVQRGHINRTYVSTVRTGDTERRYVHQLINTHVFPDPPRMMENIRRVVEHLANKRPGDRGLLQLVHDDHGNTFYQDENGHFWRTYNFVEDSTVFDVVPSPDVAYAAAVAFGEFLQDLADLPHHDFHITLPDFHNTPKRIGRFKEALAHPVPGRAELCAPEAEFVLSHQKLATKLMAVLTQHPEATRVTHNDTKVNNVLFCAQTLKGLTVIDLDTVMPGTVLFDIGDLVRTACNTAAEDETDLTKVNFDFDRFAAIVQGFAETTGRSLHPAEWEAMPYAGAVITMECGTRFLTDFLEGDRYFRTHREDHNLDRARTQFRLVQQMLDRLPELQQTVQKNQSHYA